MHLIPEKTSGTGWWDASQARFHLCLPKTYRDYVRQGRFAPLGSRPERGAGRQFARLKVISAKISLSRPAHQPPVRAVTLWRAQRVSPKDHTGRAANRWASVSGNMTLER